MNLELPADLPRRAEFTCSDSSHEALGRGGVYVLHGSFCTLSLMPIPGKEGVAPDHARFPDRWRAAAIYHDDYGPEESDGWIFSAFGPDVRTACEGAARRIRMGCLEHDFEFMDVLDWKQEAS